MERGVYFINGIPFAVDSTGKGTIIYSLDENYSVTPILNGFDLKNQPEYIREEDLFRVKGKVTKLGGLEYLTAF